MSDQKKPDRLLRLPEVRYMTGLSRTKIYELEREGRFPRRRKLSQRTCAWLSNDIEEWIKSRPIAGERVAGV